MASNTGCNSPGDLEITPNTPEVAVCCSRASASSRVRPSSCFFNSISELGPSLTCALAFVPAERSLRPRVGFFAPLRDKATPGAARRSAQPFLAAPKISHGRVAGGCGCLRRCQRKGTGRAPLALRDLVISPDQSAPSQCSLRAERDRSAAWPEASLCAISRHYAVQHKTDPRGQLYIR